MAITTTVRSISVLLALALSAAPANQALAWAPEEDAPEENAEGEPAEGEPAAGEPAEGEPAEGEAAEGEPAEGEAEEGEAAEGEGEEAPAEEEAEPEEEPEEEAPPEEEAAEPPPPTPTGPQRPDEPTIGGRPAKGTGLMGAGGALLGLGAVGIIVTALVTRKCSYDGPLQCKHQDQDEFLIPLTVTPTVLGAVLLAVGAGYRVRYNRWEAWTPGKAKATIVTPTLTRNGGGVAISGRF